MAKWRCTCGEHGTRIPPVTCEGSVSVPRQLWGQCHQSPLPSVGCVPISHLHRSQINPLLLCSLPAIAAKGKEMSLIWKLCFLILAVSELTWNIRVPRAARSTSPPAHTEINQMCSQRESPRIMWRMAASVSSLQAENVAHCRGLAMVSHKKTASRYAGSLFLWGSCALLASSGNPSWRWEVLDLQSVG